MKFAKALIGAAAGLPLFLSPVYAEQNQQKLETEKETPAAVQQDSGDAQQEMDDVGKEAMDSADEKTGELKQDSSEAQKEMDDVGADALTEKGDEEKSKPAN